MSQDLTVLKVVTHFRINNESEDNPIINVIAEKREDLYGISDIISVKISEFKKLLRKKLDPREKKEVKRLLKIFKNEDEYISFIID